LFEFYTVLRHRQQHRARRRDGIECIRQTESVLGEFGVELVTSLRHHEHDLPRRLAKPLDTIRGCGLLAPRDLLLYLRAQAGAVGETRAELVVDGRKRPSRRLRLRGHLRAFPCPLIITQGTIAYLFTFDKGYRFMWLDSGGPITPQLIGVMNRVGRTNFAIASYTVRGIPDLQVPVTMALAELFQPDVFAPCHHDQILGLGSAPPTPGGFVLPDMATEPNPPFHSNSS